jgi:6-methylsalicylate decarboxylase
VRSTGLIDVHHHLQPPQYIAQLKGNQRLAPVQLSWTAEGSVEQMDAAGVSVSVTSMTTPGLWFGENEPARKLTRMCNDYAAGLVSRFPGRFGMFANLPMPDVAGSLEEIRFGMDELRADGVAMFTSYPGPKGGNLWLGDPAFDPVFEELNRRKAVVYTHPTTCSCCVDMVPGIVDSAIEYQTDTTRAIARYVFSGSAARYRQVRMIWSHGGGTMPYLVRRFINIAKQREYSEQLPDGFLPAVKPFYYDVAQVAHRPALSALTNVVPSSQILFGTDYPWATAKEHAQGLEEAGVFSAEEMCMVERGNAIRLFPQYASD